MRDNDVNLKFNAPNEYWKLGDGYERKRLAENTKFKITFSSTTMCNKSRVQCPFEDYLSNTIFPRCAAV